MALSKEEISRKLNQAHGQLVGGNYNYWDNLWSKITTQRALNVVIIAMHFFIQSGRRGYLEIIYSDMMRLQEPLQTTFVNYALKVNPTERTKFLELLERSTQTNSARLFDIFCQNILRLDSAFQPDPIRSSQFMELYLLILRICAQPLQMANAEKIAAFLLQSIDAGMLLTWLKANPRREKLLSEFTLAQLEYCKLETGELDLTLIDFILGDTTALSATPLTPENKLKPCNRATVLSAVLPVFRQDKQKTFEFLVSQKSLLFQVNRAMLALFEKHAEHAQDKAAFLALLSDATSELDVLFMEKLFEKLPKESVQSIIYKMLKFHQDSSGQKLLTDQQMEFGIEAFNPAGTNNLDILEILFGGTLGLRDNPAYLTSIRTLCRLLDDRSRFIKMLLNVALRTEVRPNEILLAGIVKLVETFHARGIKINFIQAQELLQLPSYNLFLPVIEAFLSLDDYRARFVQLTETPLQRAFTDNFLKVEKSHRGKFLELLELSLQTSSWSLLEAIAKPLLRRESVTKSDPARSSQMNELYQLIIDACTQPSQIQNAETVAPLVLTLMDPAALIPWLKENQRRVKMFSELTVAQIEYCKTTTGELNLAFVDYMAGIRATTLAITTQNESEICDEIAVLTAVSTVFDNDAGKALDFLKSRKDRLSHLSRGMLALFETHAKDVKDKTIFLEVLSDATTETKARFMKAVFNNMPRREMDSIIQLLNKHENTLTAEQMEFAIRALPLGRGDGRITFLSLLFEADLDTARLKAIGILYGIISNRSDFIQGLLEAARSKTLHSNTMLTENFIKVIMALHSKGVAITFDYAKKLAELSYAFLFLPAIKAFSNEAVQTAFAFVSSKPDVGAIMKSFAVDAALKGNLDLVNLIVELGFRLSAFGRIHAGTLDAPALHGARTQLVSCIKLIAPTLREAQKFALLTEIQDNPGLILEQQHALVTTFSNIFNSGPSAANAEIYQLFGARPKAGGIVFEDEMQQRLFSNWQTTISARRGAIAQSGASLLSLTWDTDPFQTPDVVEEKETKGPSQ